VLEYALSSVLNISVLEYALSSVLNISVLEYALYSVLNISVLEYALSSVLNISAIMICMRCACCLPNDVLAACQTMCLLPAKRCACCLLPAKKSHRFGILKATYKSSVGLCASTNLSIVRRTEDKRQCSK